MLTRITLTEARKIYYQKKHCLDYIVRVRICSTGTVCVGRTVFTWDAPDTDLAGYLANLKAGYRISGEAGYPAGFSTQRSKYEIKKKPSVTKVSFSKI
jgi:hypothetical protein